MNRKHRETEKSFRNRRGIFVLFVMSSGSHGDVVFTCVLESGQEDSNLAALVPVPHPVQPEVPPESPILLRPLLSHQLLQSVLTSTRLPTEHLNHPVNKEQDEVRQAGQRTVFPFSTSRQRGESSGVHSKEEAQMRERGDSKGIKKDSEGYRGGSEELYV